MIKNENNKDSKKSVKKITNSKNTIKKNVDKNKKQKITKTTKKHISEMSKFKFDALKLEISIIQKFTENLEVPEVEDLEDFE
jgi:hypothetical protein